MLVFSCTITLWAVELTLLFGEFYAAGSENDHAESVLPEHESVALW